MAHLRRSGTGAQTHINMLDEVSAVAGATHTTLISGRTKQIGRKEQNYTMFASPFVAPQHGRRCI